MRTKIKIASKILAVGLFGFLVFQFVNTPSVSAAEVPQKDCSDRQDPRERQGCNNANDIAEEFCSGDLSSEREFLCGEANKDISDRNYTGIAEICENHEKDSETGEFCVVWLNYNYSAGGTTRGDGAVVGSDGEIVRDGFVRSNDTECDFDGDGEIGDGFVTANPFGTENQDFREMANGQYCVAKQQGDDISTNPIFTLLNTVIQFLSAGIFIVGILMITVSGIQYITAGGNPEATKAARERIGNVVLGLVLYFFFVAIMQFLIPGGIFN